VVLGISLVLLLIAAGTAVGTDEGGKPPAAPRPGDWPSFRGPRAAGVADGQNLPDAWDAEAGTHVRWKVAIPGLAHSSPVIWGDRLFITTAVSSRDDASFKHGLYGSGDASPDRSPHKWQVICLDKRTGEILWTRTAHEGEPKDKRHIKATYANSSPATDGRYVVALFGSEGLFAYDVNGEFLWRKDLGRLDVGAYDVPDYEWGSASSPILYRDLVIVQCDTQADSFVTAINVKTGETVWKTERDELPSWGTPTVYDAGDRHELVTNGSKFVRGYDPLNGKELWRLGGSSNITAPTPVFNDDLIVVASGRRPTKPIFAIRPGATGDITLPEGKTSSKSIAWSSTGRGPYMPTPVIYGGRLYVLNNNGVLDCYELETGKRFYRERIPHVGGGFSGSPVAADGKLYLPGEDGDIFVVKAGPAFELLAQNPMGERIMASPALSEGTLYIRAEHHLFAIGRSR
jgi:outer membrane protein assembly factor BamB